MSLHIRAGTESEPEAMAEINTTPLVDVLLVLLVMLIISIPVRIHSADVEMPSPNTPPPPVRPRIVQIAVTPAGQFTWDGEALAGRTALETRLRAAATEAQPPEIHLQPHPRAKYEAVATALSLAQGAGLAKVGLVGATAGP